MAKLKIKNTQLAKALKIKGVKAKPKPSKKEEKPEEEETKPRRQIKARKKSAFTPTEETPKVEEAAPAAEPEAAREKAPPPPPEKKEEKKEEKIDEKAQIKANIKANLERAQKEKERPARKKPGAPAGPQAQTPTASAETHAKGKKKVREFRDFKPKPGGGARPFDSRDRHGLRGADEGWRRRRRRPKSQTRDTEATTVRPSELKVRIPITIKDLAAEMKLKASELITKLFLQGNTLTLNDALDDETTIQLLGHEFGCEITIDTSEEERIRITEQTVREEITAADSKNLKPRSPVVAFMGHVDHGKTSLIDKIRESNIASGEAGAITQHIGAFQCSTEVGPITILDTPGHEAFTAMRARGADVTDVVVLVIAGDEGIRPQTEEAIQHAKAAGVTILVAINKCDKPDFNAENVYRQLSDLELLPEAWGGETITVNCSAVTGEGIPQLLEMIALQTEVLELKADPTARARGTVIESEMHKGLGSVATVLVQNGTLRRGDALVFTDLWGRIKTMQDEFGKHFDEAGPATPVAITGLSGVPEAGSTFIVVDNEKEAATIAEARAAAGKQAALLKRKKRMVEAVLEGAEEEKKVARLIIRADVQGSLEALKNSLQKIESDKAEIDVIFSGVGTISESDVELALASNAIILGFHTKVESHADPLIKKHQVTVRLHDIIYHAIDDIKEIMTGKLDKVAEERDMGSVVVRAVFKASALGNIAGCYVNEGLVHRNHRVRILREGERVWEGGIASIRRDKEDVKEVRAGLECGIVLDGFNEIQEGDVIQSYEIVYVSQEL